jgi:battenin
MRETKELEETSEGTSTLSDVPPKASWHNWFCFWILGSLNNFAYVVILCGAKSLATNDFTGAKSLIGVVNWALVAIGVFARTGNALYLINLTARKRTSFTCIGFFVGMLLLVLSPQTGSFWVAIVGIVIIGGACSFGESVILGYLKSFPVSLTGAWSSGTGMAGIGGSLWYLALSSANLSDTLIFGTMMLSIPVYWLAFISISVVPNGASSDDGLYEQLSTPRDSGEASEDGEALLAGEGGSYQKQGGVVGDAVPAEESTWQRVRRIVNLVWYYGVNLALVYIFEYVVSVGFAAVAEGPSKVTNESDDMWVKSSYQIFGFCYQFGVLLSRCCTGE